MGPLGWLVGYVLASAVSSVIVVRLAQFALGGVVEIAGVVKNTLFVGTWTAVTSALGMRAFKKNLQRLRKSKLVSMMEDGRKETPL